MTMAVTGKYKQNIDKQIGGLEPTPKQLIESLECVIAIKENELLLEGYLFKDKPYSKGDTRYELLALYRARDLLELEYKKLDRFTTVSYGKETLEGFEKAEGKCLDGYMCYDFGDNLISESKSKFYYHIEVDVASNDCAVICSDRYYSDYSVSADFTDEQLDIIKDKAQKDYKAFLSKEVKRHENHIERD